MDLNNQEPVERIWALTEPVIAAHDKPRQLEWLAHIGDLAKQAEGRGQRLDQHKTFKVCRLAIGYALAGEYLRAEYLMKRHQCQGKGVGCHHLSAQLARRTPWSILSPSSTAWCAPGDSMKRSRI
jgi:hypothetical protein